MTKNIKQPTLHRMLRCSQHTLPVLVAALLLAAGCGDTAPEKTTPDKSTPEKKSPSKTTGNGSVDEGGKTDQKTSSLPPPPKLEIAAVPLTAAERETCLVKVGDPFPDVALKDVAGAAASAVKQPGSLGTLVIVWTSKADAAQSRDALVSVLSDTAGVPEAELSFVAVGDDAAAAKTAADGWPVNLVDADGALAKALIKPTEGKPAAEFLPRVYLLDPQGKILWFSLGYSVPAGRELQNAIKYLQSKKPG